MAPTVCIDDETPRCSGRALRKSRRIESSTTTTTTTTFSVISYAGKITHRRSCKNRHFSRALISFQSTSNNKTVEQMEISEDNDIITDSSSSSSSLSESSLSPRNHNLLINGRSSSPLSETSSGCSSDDSCSSILSNDNSCRCDSLNISDFDDDGFKDDAYDHSYNRPENEKRRSNNAKGLLDIAVKTVKLIKRNQLLQAKLVQLQSETKAFIESVMANPENLALRTQVENNHKSLPAKMII